MQQEPVRPKERFLVFGAPPIEEAEVGEVVASMRSGWLGTGPKVAQLEADFARYRRAPQAVAGNPLTAALHLSMLAPRLRPRGRGTTPPPTFSATRDPDLPP